MIQVFYPQPWEISSEDIERLWKGDEIGNKIFLSPLYFLKTAEARLFDIVRDSHRSRSTVTKTLGR